MKKRMIPIFVLILGLIFFGLSSCKKQVFFAGEDAIIRLSTPSLNIDLNGSVTIFILGYNGDGSYLWDGTRIDLSIENGTLNKTYVELEDGAASVIASANMQRGEMKIYASSGNAVAEPDPLVITVGSIPEVNQIIVSLNPPVLPYTGGRVEINVTIYDSYLQPMPGITVIFSTDAGSLDSGSTPLTTNQAGQVVDYLQTDRDSIITIYAGEREQTVSVTLEAPPDPNIEPVADFTYSPMNPVSLETIYFNASGSYDSDGSIESYSWDFGDGSSGRGKKPTHQYDVDPFSYKTYTVTLTVYDDQGAQASTSKEITVTLK